MAGVCVYRPEPAGNRPAVAATDLEGKKSRMVGIDNINFIDKGVKEDIREERGELNRAVPEKTVPGAISMGEV